LRAIDGFSRILVEEFKTELSEDAQRYLRIICENTESMARLIDDLLVFSRLNRQPLKKVTVKPTELVQQSLEMLEPDTRDRQIEFNIGKLPACQADPTLLKQVYVNLLSNAIKFTRRTDKAVIEVGSLREDGHVIYYVKDNGVGFDMQYAPKLFGVFQRLHRVEDYEGTGVGLAIVQRIIHRHGGRVWAEGSLNQGATFCFNLNEEHSS
jgi:light-regulated signal transduction histidine kinase (bacteriophytochrome)